MKRLIPKNPNNHHLKAYAQAVVKGGNMLHAVKHENGWAVKKIGKRPIKIYDTQAQAEEHIRARKKTKETIGFVHRKDGSILKTI